MHLSKSQLEFYPMEVYRSIYNYQDYEVIKFESPDFIIWKNGVEKIGLEATSPSSKEQNQLRNIANSESRDGLGRKYGYEKYKKDGKIYSNGVEIQSSESKVIHDIILNGIESKLIKLNTNYTLFDKNILCCTPITAFLNNKNDNNYLIEGLNRINCKYKIKFDEVVVITYDKVIRYSLNKEDNYLLDSDMDLSEDQIREIIELIHDE